MFSSSFVNNGIWWTIFKLSSAHLVKEGQNKKGIMCNKIPNPMVHMLTIEYCLWKNWCWYMMRTCRIGATKAIQSFCLDLGWFGQLPWHAFVLINAPSMVDPSIHGCRCSWSTSLQGVIHKCNMNLFINTHEGASPFPLTINFYPPIKALHFMENFLLAWSNCRSLPLKTQGQLSWQMR